MWIEVHQALLSHRKTLRLARLTGIDKWGCTGRLIALWTWALDNAADGVIKGDDADILTDVMGWEDTPEKLIDVLVTSGFLERHETTLIIHDWNEYAGKLMERREAIAEKQRRYRERLKKDTLPTQSSNDDDTEPLRGSNVTVTLLPTVPNPTVPNRTVPNRTQPEIVTREKESSVEEDCAIAPTHDNDFFPDDVETVAQSAGFTTYNSDALRRVLKQYYTQAPNGDVLIQIAKMQEWLAEPKQQKQHRKMSYRFFTNWLEKAAGASSGTTYGKPIAINTGSTPRPRKFLR